MGGWEKSLKCRVGRFG